MALIRRPSRLPEVESLRDVTERIFDDRPWRPLWGIEREAMPALDIYATATEIVAKVALPGAHAEDIEVTIDGDCVTVGGEFRAQEEVKAAGYVRRELGHGKFSRHFILPTAVKADEAQASFADGLLTIHLPKVEETTPRQIKVDIRERPRAGGSRHAR
jgi:HSP20 family protein